MVLFTVQFTVAEVEVASLAPAPAVAAAVAAEEGALKEVVP
jgi:hypothetical protein